LWLGEASAEAVFKEDAEYEEEMKEYEDGKYGY
jgi:hypothetical protein